MSENKKHIDDLFRDGLDDCDIPLTNEDDALFDEKILPKKRLLKPKYVKWLPYLAALSAAAASVVYYSNPTPLPQNEYTITKNSVQKQEGLVAVDSMQLLNTRNNQLLATDSQHTSKFVIHTQKDNHKVRLAQSILLRSNRGGIMNEFQSDAPALSDFKERQNPNEIDFSFLWSDDEKLKYNDKSSRKISVLTAIGSDMSVTSPRRNSILGLLELRCRVAPKLYIGVQAVFKTGYTEDIYLPKYQTTYSKPVSEVNIVDNGFVPGTFDYYYSEVYDSVSISYEYNSSTYDIELPLFWEYKIHKRVSLVAGIKFTYSSLPKIRKIENRYTILYVDSTLAVPFKIEDNNSFFEGQCNCVSDNMQPYENAEYKTLRTGYMLGVRIEPIKRISLDVSLQQNASDLSYIPNPEIKRIYNAPQLRFAIGYRLLR